MDVLVIIPSNFVANVLFIFSGIQIEMKQNIGTLYTMKRVALLMTVVILQQSSAQNEYISLVSSVDFDVNPLPSLCPGSKLQFTCIAMNFPPIDWLRNDMTLEQYTPTSIVGLQQNLTSYISVILNKVNVIDAATADYNTTLTATINEGLSSGDIISCGNRLLNTTELAINYTTIPSPLVPPLNDDLYTIESSEDFEQSVTLTIIFDDIFSRENRVDSYCVSSQSSVCPSDSCVSPSYNYSCDSLIAGGDYNFTVRAVNCGNQEGDETEQLTISPRVPSAPPSCEVIAIYAQSNGTLSGIMTSWTQSENPPNITSSMTQDVLFYNITYMPTVGYSPHTSLSADDCGEDDGCNYTMRQRLEESSYIVKVAASNFVGVGESTTCQGQIDYHNFVFGVSITAPALVGDDTTISCQFSSGISSPNITRQCQICYSTLVNSRTLSNCETITFTLESDQLSLFTVQFPSTSGGSYGPFFFEMTATEDDTVLSVVEGQVFTGCSPLRLGSISTPQINSRCSSLLDDMSQLVEGIQDENIIFCYSSEATLQGAVAMAYCNEGFERVGPDRVTCSPDGSWGELPTCQRISTASSGFLTAWNSVLIAIGLIAWLIAAVLNIIGYVVLLLMARQRFNANFRFWHGVFILMLFLTTVLLVVCAALWITLGVIVGTYRDGSEADMGVFTDRRDGLCISSFLVSLLSTAIIIIGLSLIKLMPKVLSSKMSVDITHSDDLNESCDKTAEEIPLNGSTITAQQSLNGHTDQTETKTNKDKNLDINETMTKDSPQNLPSNEDKLESDHDTLGEIEDVAHVRPTEEAGVSVPDNEQEREANDDVDSEIPREESRLQQDDNSINMVENLDMIMQQLQADTDKLTEGAVTDESEDETIKKDLSVED